MKDKKITDILPMRVSFGFFCLLFIFAFFSLSSCKNESGKNVAAQKDSYEYNNLIAELGECEKPVKKGNYIVFTHEDGPTYVGIAFDFEGYKKVHVMKKKIFRNMENEEERKILCYALERPKDVSRIGYRYIIDGLWTRDDITDTSEYSPSYGTVISYIDIGKPEKEATKVIDGEKVRFVYYGKSGERVRLAGNFTDWDSFIYLLQETKPGFYELTLPLPQGSYYYNYYIGLKSVRDATNRNRAYTKDGRESSVIEIK